MVPSGFSMSKGTSTGTVQIPSDDNYHLRYQHHRPLPQDQGPFSHRFREEDEMYGHCKQNNATAHSDWLEGIQQKIGKVAIAAPWILRLNTCNYYLWQALEDGLYTNNSHSLQQTNDHIHTEIASISSQELCCQQILAESFEACLEAGGWYLQYCAMNCTRQMDYGRIQTFPTSNNVLAAAAVLRYITKTP
jgi:hypothetical protein